MPIKRAFYDQRLPLFKPLDERQEIFVERQFCMLIRSQAPCKGPWMKCLEEETSKSNTIKRMASPQHQLLKISKISWRGLESPSRQRKQNLSTLKKSCPLKLIVKLQTRYQYQLPS